MQLLYCSYQARPDISISVGLLTRVQAYPSPELLKRAEREYLSTLLRRNRGGIATTAEAAMIDAATLHRKMKLHALKREDFKEIAKTG